MIRHQTLDRLVVGRPGEAEGIVVGVRSRHPRIPVAEHDHLVVADDGRRPVELLLTQLRDPCVDLGCVHGRVEDLALLAPRAADQHGVHPLGVVSGHGSGTLRRLVVGMGMNGEETERLRHGAHATGQ